MAKGRDYAFAKVLLVRHGRTFSDELDIELHANTPSALFRFEVKLIVLDNNYGAVARNIGKETPYRTI